MYIVNKERDSMINAARTDCIHIGEDGRTIKTIVGDMARMYRIGVYQTHDEAKIAMEMIAAAMKADEAVFFMPDDDGTQKVQRARTRERPEKFARDGKKPVRRGGS